MSFEIHSLIVEVTLSSSNCWTLNARSTVLDQILLRIKSDSRWVFIGISRPLSVLLPSHQQGEFLTKQKGLINICATLSLLCQLQVLIFPHFPQSIKKAKLKCNITIPQVWPTLNLAGPSDQVNWQVYPLLSSRYVQNVSRKCSLLITGIATKSTYQCKKIHVREVSGAGLFPVSLLISIQIDSPLCWEQMRTPVNSINLARFPKMSQLKSANSASYSPIPATFKQVSDCGKISMKAWVSTSPDHGWDHECSLTSGSLVSSCDDHAQPVNNLQQTWSHHYCTQPNQYPSTDSAPHCSRLPKSEKICPSHLLLTWRENAFCCAWNWLPWS